MPWKAIQQSSDGIHGEENLCAGEEERLWSVSGRQAAPPAPEQQRRRQQQGRAQPRRLLGQLASTWCAVRSGEQRSAGRGAQQGCGFGGSLLLSRCLPDFWPAAAACHLPPCSAGAAADRSARKVIAAAVWHRPGPPTAAVAQLPSCHAGDHRAASLAATSLATGAAANSLRRQLDGYSQVRCACQ